MEHCKMFIKPIEAILSRRRVQSGAAPAVLLPVQTFSVYMMHFVCKMYKGAGLYKKDPAHFAVTELWQVLRTLLQYSLETLSVQDRFTQGLAVKKSKIPHDDLGSGLFTAQSFSNEEVQRFYYRSLFCVELTRERQKAKNM